MCVALDDTILRKRGRTIPGAAYRRDPLGPPFQVNLVWAQREQAMSAAIADGNGDVRMVPIGFRDASTPRKPRKGSAPEEMGEYLEEMKQRNLNALAVETLTCLKTPCSSVGSARMPSSVPSPQSRPSGGAGASMEKTCQPPSKSVKTRQSRGCPSGRGSTASGGNLKSKPLPRCAGTSRSTTATRKPLSAWPGTGAQPQLGNQPSGCGSRRIRHASHRRHQGLRKRGQADRHSRG